jgi:IclR family KDG regulon transcriptional repressor
MTEAGSPGVHAALRVLESISAHGPQTLADLSSRLGIAKSSLHRVCRILLDRSWIYRHLDGRFDLGVRAVGLGARPVELPLVTAFRSVAAELLTRHDETVCLAVLDGDDSVYVALEETSQPVRLVTNVGRRTPAFAAASGRVMLASWSPEAVTARYGGRPLVTPTGRRLTGVDELTSLLSLVRKLGYAENDGETAEGLYTVSVPVLNSSRAVLAALTICVPTSRAAAERRERLIADMLATGARLSDMVSWLPAWNATRAEPGEGALVSQAG